MDYFLIAIITWLSILSFYLVKAVNNWKKLTKNASDLDLEKILQSIMIRQDLAEKQISELTEKIASLQRKQLINFQKYALIRYNPFEDTGGDQSFIIALLDGFNNGVVVSSMHTRSGTRVYAKEIVQGKPTVHQFSKEEKEAVDKACQTGRLTALPTHSALKN